MGILCGIDIIEIERIKEAILSNGGLFTIRIFTSNEIEYCESKKSSKYQSYAARFCAKEALLKALGTGLDEGMNWQDIEVLASQNSKPVLRLFNKVLQTYNHLNGSSISLSLSHSREYAVASVVIETINY